METQTISHHGTAVKRVTSLALAISRLKLIGLPAGATGDPNGIHNDETPPHILKDLPLGPYRTPHYLFWYLIRLSLSYDLSILT